MSSRTFFVTFRQEQIKTEGKGLRSFFLSKCDEGKVKGRHSPHPERVLAEKFSCLEPRRLWRQCSIGGTRPTYESRHSRVKCPAQDRRQEQPKPEQQVQISRKLHLTASSIKFTTRSTHCKENKCEHTLKNGLWSSCFPPLTMGSSYSYCLCRASGSPFTRAASALPVKL